MNRKERRLKHLQHCKKLAQANFDKLAKATALEKRSFEEPFPSHDVKASGIFNSVYAKY